MGKNPDTKYYIADLNKAGWEEVRALAEEWINRGYFDQDPVQAVVNAYVTILLLERDLDEKTPNDLVH